MIDLNLLFSDYLYIVHKLQHEKAKSFLGGFKGRVLDIGCGRRPYKKFLPSDTYYVGVDRNSLLMPDLVLDAEKISFKESSFDGIVACEVLEHLKEPAVFLVHLNSYLKKGGLLYISAPMNWNLHYEPDDYYRFTRYGLEYLLEKNGFKVIRVERIGGFFSLVTVKLIDVFVCSILFNLTKVLRIERGKYRIAAILTAPFSLVFLIFSRFFDKIDSRDAIGWSFLVEKL